MRRKFAWGNINARHMRRGRNEVEQVIARRLLLLLQKDAAFADAWVRGGPVNQCVLSN